MKVVPTVHLSPSSAHEFVVFATNYGVGSPAVMGGVSRFDREVVSRPRGPEVAEMEIFATRFRRVARTRTRLRLPVGSNGLVLARHECFVRVMVAPTPQGGPTKGVATASTEPPDRLGMAHDQARRAGCLCRMGDGARRDMEPTICRVGPGRPLGRARWPAPCWRPAASGRRWRRGCGPSSGSGTGVR